MNEEPEKPYKDLPHDVTKEMIGDINYNWDTESIKVVCASCHKAIEIRSLDLLKHLKLYRKKVTLSLWKQFHIKFLFFDLTLSFWKKSKPTQPRSFIR